MRFSLRYLLCAAVVLMVLVVALGAGGVLAQQQTVHPVPNGGKTETEQVTLSRVRDLEKAVTEMELKIARKQDEIQKLGGTLSASHRKRLTSFQTGLAEVLGLRHEGNEIPIFVPTNVKNDFRVGDKLLIVRRGELRAVGQAVVVRLEKRATSLVDGGKPYIIVWANITDVGRGIRAEDYVYITNRDSSPFSVAKMRIGQD